MHHTHVSRSMLRSALALFILAVGIAELPAQQKAPVQQSKTPIRYKAIWEPVNYSKDVELTDVFFVNADTGWVAGHKPSSVTGGFILRTTDGGANWRVAVGDPEGNERPFGDFRFVDATHGFAVQPTGSGDHTLLTTSDGQSWEATGTVPQHRGDYAFVSPTDGVASHSADILRTSDGGRSWQKTFTCAVKVEVNGLSRDAHCQVETFHFPSARVGYGLGYATGGVHGVFVVKTEDAGQTWTAWQVLPAESGKESHVYFTDENTGVACLIGGHLVRTRDGGKSWQGIAGATCQGKPAIQFAGSVGWFAKSRDLGYTTDGGSRWTSRSVTFPAMINAFSLPRPDRGYVVGDHGMVYRYRVVPEKEPTPKALAAPVMRTP